MAHLLDYYVCFETINTIPTMRFILPALLILVVALAPSTSHAQSEADAIRQMLDQRDQQIKAVLGSSQSFSDAQRNQLKSMINDVIDFRAMARTALGTHWNEITPAQQAEFVDVFADVVRAQSLSNLDIYRSSVKYDDIDVDGNRASVETTTTYKGTQMAVSYSMAKSNGEWHVTDIILDGTSTAQGYANSFQRVFKRHGFDRLLDSLRSRAERS